VISQLLIPTSTLQQAVQKMALASSAASDSLRWVRVEGTGNALRFFTNTKQLDTEIYVELETPHNPFTFEVSGPLLKSIGGLLPEENTEIRVGEGEVTIHSGRSQFHLACNADDASHVRKADLSSVQLMDTNFPALFESFAKVGYASEASCGHRPYAECVAVRGPRLFATDGFRASSYPNMEINFRDPVFLNTVQLAILAKIYKGVGTIGGLAISRERLILSCQGVTTTLRASNIKDDGPDYNSAIPCGPCSSVRVNKAHLKDAVARSLAVASAKAPRTVIYFSAGELRFKTEGDGIVTTDLLECDYSGPDVELIINPNFFLQAVRSVEDSSGEVILEIRGGKNPLVVADSQREHINVICLVRI